jgi:hypothetical protein
LVILWETAFPIIRERVKLPLKIHYLAYYNAERVPSEGPHE